MKNDQIHKYCMIGPLVLLKKIWRAKFFSSEILQTKCCCFLTYGNVVRGGKSYANEILTAASGHDLHAVHRMSTKCIVMVHVFTISQRENRHLGNVVLNTFHFYSRWKRWIYELGFLRPSNSISVIPRRWEAEHERLGLVSGRISLPAEFEPATPWFEVGSANRSAKRTLLRCNRNNCGQLLILISIRCKSIAVHLALKIGHLYFHAHTYFIWCRNESCWEPHCPISENLTAKVLKN